MTGDLGRPGTSQPPKAPLPCEMTREQWYPLSFRRPAPATESVGTMRVSGTPHLGSLGARKTGGTNIFSPDQLRWGIWRDGGAVKAWGPELNSFEIYLAHSR